MRITKSLLAKVRTSLIESQARLCAVIGAAGDKWGDALWEVHQRRYPHYVGGRPERDAELLRQLLYDDVNDAIPGHLTD